MINSTIEIELDYKKLGFEKKSNAATMTMYIRDTYPQYQNPFKRPLLIICPGGGYDHHSPREGEAIAIRMLDLGLNCIVLRYSLEPDRFPCQLFEAAYAVRYARQHAEEWDSDPDKVIIAGFSAGGHVASSLGAFYNKDLMKPLLEELKASPEEIRPDKLLLGYPVITSGEYAHKGSFEKLLGTDSDDKLREMVSIEKHIDSTFPPSFIWHTQKDGSVPVMNSILLLNELIAKQVDTQFHIFTEGKHGLGLGTKDTDTKNCDHYQPEIYVWTDMFAQWAKES